MFRYVFVAVGLLAVLGVLAAVKGAQISSLIATAKAFEAAGPPPEIVGTATAREESWEATIAAVGTTVSSRGVTVSNEVPGTVSRLHFESGRIVERGAALLELDASVERAELAALRARMELAQKTLARSQQLAASGVIARERLEADEATFRSLAAEGQALEARIAKKILRAPFSGKLGLRQVNLGQYLMPGTPIVDLESTDSLFVDFTLPEHQLDHVSLGMPLRATLGGDARHAIEGRISAVDGVVDAMTRNGRVRAELPRSDQEMRPGAFVNVAVVLPARPRVVTIPLTAVIRASYGDSLYVVEDPPGGTPRTTPDGKPIRQVRQQFVRLGQTRGDYVAVLEGTKAGEEVVTAGAFKLRNGAPVTVDNSVQPKAELAPVPEAR